MPSIKEHIAEDSSARDSKYKSNTQNFDVQKQANLIFQNHHNDIIFIENQNNKFPDNKIIISPSKIKNNIKN